MQKLMLKTQLKEDDKSLEALGIKEGTKMMLMGVWAAEVALALGPLLMNYPVFFEISIHQQPGFRLWKVVPPAELDALGGGQETNWGKFCSVVVVAFFSGTLMGSPGSLSFGCCPGQNLGSAESWSA